MSTSKSNTINDNIQRVIESLQDLDKSINIELEKGKKYEIGRISTYADGTKKQKQADGSWKTIRDDHTTKIDDKSPKKPRKEIWDMTLKQFISNPPPEADIWLSEDKPPLRAKLGYSRTS